jgi:uncharacterized protein
MATTYLTPGVYVEEVKAASGTLTAGATAVAAFVGFTEKAPDDNLENDPDGVKPRLVTNWSQFEKLYGGFVKGAKLPYAVYGYFNNGGSLAYIVRVPNTKPADEPGTLTLPAADRTVKEAVAITAAEAKDKITVQVLPETDATDDAPPTFTLRVLKEGEEEAEEFKGLTLTPGKQSIDTVVNKDSKRVKVETKADTSKIAVEFATLPPGNYPVPAAPPLPVPVKTREFSGNENARTGINGLVIADEVTMVMVPDLVTAATTVGEDGKEVLDRGMWKAVQTALINHCEGQANRMAILDTPPGLSPQEVLAWRRDEAMYASHFAALYYPWIQVTNPIGSNGDAEILVPPCGHIAGIWARNDDERGVWKAPANEVVRGALKLATDTTHAEQSLLNPEGINCIRAFGSRGVRVWGARTLGEESGEWKYINVRRLFNMIETTIMNGTQFAVFEPNDQRLWSGLTRTVSSFLRGLWRDGALFGATAEQAFYVKCDNETNPPESIDQGKVVVEVGVAPVKPAEFVIFRIAQIKETSA